MVEQGGWPRRRLWYLTWGLVVTIGLGAVGVGAWRFWDHVTAFGGWFLRHSEGVRNLTLSAGALAGVIVGLPLLWWRTWNVHRQAKAALRQAETAAQRHESQAEADRERRITESFATAVELLGHEDRSVRLGAIYALERIARQNQDEHGPIMDTLSAYVRQWSERREREAGEINAAADLEPAPADIQAAFTVLGRRSVEHEWDEDLDMRVKVRLDLTGAYLVGANPDPPTGYSRGRAFDLAKLSGANLHSADLSKASLRSANLKDAILSKADLNEACLHHAVLVDAELGGADLFGANLKRARLDRANLAGAELETADLSGAHLDGADLSTAVGLSQEQLNSAVGDENTKIPEDFTRPARWSRSRRSAG